MLHRPSLCALVTRSLVDRRHPALCCKMLADASRAPLSDTVPKADE
jgi:hypothetical protein